MIAPFEFVPGIIFSRPLRPFRPGDGMLVSAEDSDPRCGRYRLICPPGSGPKGWRAESDTGDRWTITVGSTTVLWFELCGPDDGSDEWLFDLMVPHCWDGVSAEALDQPDDEDEDLATGARSAAPGADDESIVVSEAMFTERDSGAGIPSHALLLNDQDERIPFPTLKDLWYRSAHRSLFGRVMLPTKEFADSQIPSDEQNAIVAAMDSYRNGAGMSLINHSVRLEAGSTLHVGLRFPERLVGEHVSVCLRAQLLRIPSQHKLDGDGGDLTVVPFPRGG